MASKSKVYFFFDAVKPSISNRGEVKAAIQAIFKAEKIALKSLNYIFCSDKKLLSINSTYLNHNYYTDVISFDLSETTLVEGEIYISTERVGQNANNYNIPFRRELLRVMFHGALHLCGYGDKSIQQAKIIRAKEDFYLEKFFSRKSVSRGTFKTG